MCSDTEELNVSLTAKLNNGSTASATFTYEPKLAVTVYNNDNVINANYNGSYEGNSIKIETNVGATFSGKYIASTTNNSITIQSTAQTVISISTPCGQTKTIEIYPVIN